jgi:hypothetical protein
MALLAELKAQRDKRLGELRQVLRGEPVEQPELPFEATADVVDAGTGEIAPPFTLDDCRFNRKETRRAFEALAAEKEQPIVLYAMHRLGKGAGPFTMEDFKAVEAAVCGTPKGEED